VDIDRSDTSISEYRRMWDAQLTGLEVRVDDHADDLVAPLNRLDIGIQQFDTAAGR
jgi:hypothetical protein